MSGVAMNKLIRNIPDDVAELLKAQAKARGLTLEAYMRLILIEAVKSTSKEIRKSKGVADAK
jgi:plasmid stability protein